MDHQRAGAGSSQGHDPVPMVGVVVLNWNAGWFTRRCIESVARSTYPADRLRVVLVDNGSIDGSLQEIRHWLDRPDSPRVELVENPRNLGFAEGCNRGIRRLVEPGPQRADWVALLNNDAWCEPGWISEMVKVTRSDERVGAVASKLLLEPGFLSFDIDGPLRETVESVTVTQAGGPRLDVTGGVRTAGFTDEGALVWPARRIWQRAAGSAGRIWVPAGDGPCRIDVILREEGGGSRTLSAGYESESEQPRCLLWNGLGTGINESGEGYDIGYGSTDADAPGGARESCEVDGFCGGAALLRREALEEVGLFDPRFFAYYEDTDLSWRLRRSGRQIRTAPLAVVHHAFGASGGGGSRLHVFLDRRNWLLTNLRNGDCRDLRRALRWLRRGAWRLFRVNFFGRVRRGRRPQRQPLDSWVLAALSALAGAPRARLGRVPGSASTNRVKSLWQPGSCPKAPRTVPGGPLVVYLDVGETLKAGYRAGIQRVVCRMAAGLATADPHLQLVPIRWCERNRAFRRLTSEEYESLMRAGAAVPATGSQGSESLKASVRSVLAGLGVIGRVRAVRESVFGRGRRRIEDCLVVDRLAPGSVLLELDAVWNELGVDRTQLLEELRSHGVHVSTFVHDLFPIESPEWFSPELRRIFTPTARAQLHSSELLVCASPSVASQVDRVCRSAGIPAPTVRTIPLGADHRYVPPHQAMTEQADPVDPMIPPGDRFILIVGTVETRKNHLLALEVFERLAPRFEDLHLVIAGRYGWGAEEFVHRYDSSPFAGERLHWLTDVEDGYLESLYARAHTVVVPSLAEGFGLPVIEALRRGVPVIASDDPALMSAGGESAQYIPADAPQQWEEAIAAQLGDGAVHSDAVASASLFVAPQWRDSASALAQILREQFAW